MKIYTKTGDKGQTVLLADVYQKMIYALKRMER